MKRTGYVLWKVWLEFMCTIVVKGATAADDERGQAGWGVENGFQCPYVCANVSVKIRMNIDAKPGSALGCRRDGSKLGVGRVPARIWMAGERMDSARY